MDINRNNYEAFFLDYIEGRLSPFERARLMIFLADNPDLENELNNFENIILEPESIQFESKNSLKKNSSQIIEINESNFDEYCIAKLEGDLNPLEERKFNSYLTDHPGKINDYKLYLRTVLEPDKNIKFENKSKLRHRSISMRTSPLFYFLTAAASLTIVLVIYKIYNNESAISTTKITKVEQKQEPIVEQSKASLSKDENIQNNTTKIKKSNKTFFVTSDVINAVQRKNVTLLVAQKSLAINKISYLEATLAKIPDQKVHFETIEIKALSPKKPEYLTVKEYLIKNLKEVTKQDSIPLLEKKDDNLWALAKSGVSGLNKFAGTKINIDKEVDNTNNRTVYAFNSGLLGFYSSHNNK